MQPSGHLDQYFLQTEFSGMGYGQIKNKLISLGLGKTDLHLNQLALRAWLFSCIQKGLSDKNIVDALDQEIGLTHCYSYLFGSNASEFQCKKELDTSSGQSDISSIDKHEMVRKIADLVAVERKVAAEQATYGELFQSTQESLTEQSLQIAQFKEWLYFAIKPYCWADPAKGITEASKKKALSLIKSENTNRIAQDGELSSETLTTIRDAIISELNSSEIPDGAKFELSKKIQFSFSEVMAKLNRGELANEAAINAVARLLKANNMLEISLIRGVTEGVYEYDTGFLINGYEINYVGLDDTYSEIVTLPLDDLKKWKGSQIIMHYLASLAASIKIATGMPFDDIINKVFKSPNGPLCCDVEQIRGNLKAAEISDSNRALIARAIEMHTFDCRIQCNASTSLNSEEKAAVVRTIAAPSVIDMKSVFRIFEDILYRREVSEPFYVNGAGARDREDGGSIEPSSGRQANQRWSDFDLQDRNVVANKTSGINPVLEKDGKETRLQFNIAELTIVEMDSSHLYELLSRMAEIECPDINRELLRAAINRHEEGIRAARNAIDIIAVIKLLNAESGSAIRAIYTMKDQQARFECMSPKSIMVDMQLLDLAKEAVDKDDDISSHLAIRLYKSAKSESEVL